MQMQLLKNCKMQKSKEHDFIIIWCAKGLTWVEDISNLDKKAMWSVLKGEEVKTFSDHFKAVLTGVVARKNEGFEIYSISAITGIKKSDIIKMFNADPKKSAKIIREQGYKIYSSQVEERVLS